MKTRKVNKHAKKPAKKDILTIPQLRKAFDHMDMVVESLRKVAKHSFSEAVLTYREEWRKVFNRDLSPADASAYLKFRFGMKSTRKTRKMRGGSTPLGGAPLGGTPLGGAPLEYMTRPGVSGVYGQFPTYQTQGLDRYYASAITADCTNGSKAQQGGVLEGVRAFDSTAPPHALYRAEMEFKGVPPFPTSDTVAGVPSSTTVPPSYVSSANLAAHSRMVPTDLYK